MENSRVVVGCSGDASGRNAIGSNGSGRISDADGVKSTNRVGAYVGRIRINQGILSHHIPSIRGIKSPSDVAGVGPTVRPYRIRVRQCNLGYVGIVSCCQFVGVGTVVGIDQRRQAGDNIGGVCIRGKLNSQNTAIVGRAIAPGR